MSAVPSSNSLAGVAGVITEVAGVAGTLDPSLSPITSIIIGLMTLEPSAYAFFQSLFAATPAATVDQLPALAAALVSQQAAEASAAAIDAQVS
jgi:hypothetical protein